MVVDLSNGDWIQTSMAPRVCAFLSPLDVSVGLYSQFAIPSNTEMTQKQDTIETRSNYTGHVGVNLPSATLLGLDASDDRYP
jgi:hypothetical protein